VRARHRSSRPARGAEAWCRTYSGPVCTNWDGAAPATVALLRPARSLCLLTTAASSVTFSWPVKRVKRMVRDHRGAIIGSRPASEIGYARQLPFPFWPPRTCANVLSHPSAALWLCNRSESPDRCSGRYLAKSATLGHLDDPTRSLPGPPTPIRWSAPTCQ